MTNRVLMGQRAPGEYGLWVSKPGVDVMSATVDQCLLSTNRRAFQIIQHGTVGNPGVNGSVDVAIPSLGYTPLVLLFCTRSFIEFWFPSPTTLRLFNDGAWQGGGFGSYDIRYAVTNLQVLT